MIPIGKPLSLSFTYRQAGKLAVLHRAMLFPHRTSADATELHWRVLPSPPPSMRWATLLAHLRHLILYVRALTRAFRLYVTYSRSVLIRYGLSEVAQFMPVVCHPVNNLLRNDV